MVDQQDEAEEEAEVPVDDDVPAFLTVRFDGGRFLHHAAPVRALAELARLEQLIDSTAKQIFFELHSDRKRTPRNFGRAGKLYLIASEENCYTAKVARDPIEFTPIDSRDLGIYDKALERILDRIGSVKDVTVPSAPLSTEAEKQLGRLGSNLDDNEALTLIDPLARREVEVDFTVRMGLAKQSGITFESDVEVDGEVVAVDEEASTFTVRDFNGRSRSIHLIPRHYDDVVRAFKEHIVITAHVRGTFFNPPGRIERVTDVDLEDHERADEVRKIWARIDELEGVEPGWFDGEGEATSDSARGWAKRILGRLLVAEARLPAPAVFPHIDGGVSCEWYRDDRSVKIVFDAEEDLAQVTKYSAADRFLERKILPLEGEREMGLIGIALGLAKFLTGENANVREDGA